MEIAEKIVDRLPGFYRAREKSSYIYSLVEGIAKVISQQEQDISLIADSHWIDSAHGINLDLLASMLGLGRKSKETDAEYRSRIKLSLATLKKGGTVEAVKAQMAAYLGTKKDDIVLVENPPIEMLVEKSLLSGDKWNLSSSSIYDEPATVLVSLDDGEARDPTIVNLDANLTIRYNGTLKKGQVLEIQQGNAKLDGIDVTVSISMEQGDGGQIKDADLPRISRKPSDWVFSEKLTDTLGRFDQSKFDENIYYKPVPPTKVIFKWTARLLAAFEVKVTSELLEKSNMTKQELETLVNTIKAAGVRTIVTVLSDPDDLKVVEKMRERPKQSKGSGRKS